MLPRVRFALLLLLTAAFTRLVAAESAEILSLRAKAVKGNAIAQYNLGLNFIEGQQVPKDLPEAFVWLSLASENGSTGKALNSLLGTISEAQLAEGRRRLEHQRAVLAGKNTPVVRPATSASAAAPAVAVPVAAVVPSAPSAPAPKGADSSVAELASLRNDHRELSEELAAAWKESAQLKNELAASHTALEASQARIITQSTAVAKLEKDSAAKVAAETAKLSAELVAVRQQLETAKASVASHFAKMLSAEATVAVLTADKNRLLAEGHALEAAQSKAASDTGSLGREITALRQKLLASESVVAQATQAVNEIGALKSQLAASEAARASLAAQKSSADQNSARLNSANEALAAKLTEAGAALTAHEAQNRSQAAELQLARTRAEASKAPEADRDAAQSARAKAEATAESRAQEIAALTQRLAAAAATTSAAEETKAALRRAEFSGKESAAQITALKARVQSLEAARTAALTEKSQVADRAKTNAAELETARKEADAARNRFEAGAAEITRLTAQRDAAEAERAKAVMAAEAQAREISALNESLRTATAAASAGSQAQVALEKNGAQIADLKTVIDALKAQLSSSEAARLEWVTKSERAAEQTAALRAQVESLELGRAQLTNEKAALVSQLTSANSTLTSASGQDAELRKELSAKTAELQAARQNVEESREKFAASESVRRDFGNQLSAVRGQLKEAQSIAESSQAKAAKLVDENIELKARGALIRSTELDALRAQAIAAEAKAEQALKSSLALNEENARLKASLSATPAAVRAVPVRAATMTPSAPSRPANPVPVTTSSAVRSSPSTVASTAAVVGRTSATIVRTHTVQPGETLSGISSQHYGTPNRWSVILEANRDVLKDERSLTVGRVLRIP